MGSPEYYCLFLSENAVGAQWCVFWVLLAWWQFGDTHLPNKANVEWPWSFVPFSSGPWKNSQLICSLLPRRVSRIFPQTSLSPRVSSSPPLLWGWMCTEDAMAVGVAQVSGGDLEDSSAYDPSTLLPGLLDGRISRIVGPTTFLLGKPNLIVALLCYCFYGVVPRSCILHAVTSFTHKSGIRMFFSFLFHNSRHKWFSWHFFCVWYLFDSKGSHPFLITIP